MQTNRRSQPRSLHSPRFSAGAFGVAGRYSTPTTKDDRGVNRERQAFTLLEIVLVLGVIAVIVAMTAPNMLRYIGEQQIREQAHEVRMAIVRGRIKAIDSGLTYQFRYEPDGQHYVILPLDLPEGSLEQSDSFQNTPLNAEPDEPVATESGRMPEMCRFDAPRGINPATGVEQIVAGETLGQEWLSLLTGSDVADAQGTSWSPAIRFHPDGTTDNASLTILDEDGRMISIHLRGLTGTCSVGELKNE